MIRIFNLGISDTRWPIRRCAVWCSSLLLVCSSALAETKAPPISPDELLTGSALGLDSETPDTIVGSDEVMALSDDMRRFLDKHVSDRLEESYRLERLVRAVLGKNTFGLVYDDNTRTAAETFTAKRGNCLSFTIMFVVLARGVGLNARFQEVEIPPEWTFANDTYILNRHININFDLKVVGQRMVDFNIEDFDSEYDMRLVSDQRALAHFFNNLGAALLQQGDTEAAFHAFRKALSENDRSFAPAWDNLGTLYSRKGLGFHAETAYLQALEIDPFDLIAMSNLTTVYDRRGDPELAASYRNKVNSHRKKNPYYRYQLARKAFFAEDYDEAIDHLKFAMRQDKTEDRFCFLLGLVDLQMGDQEKSRKWMARAEKLAGDDPLTASTPPRWKGSRRLRGRPFRLRDSERSPEGATPFSAAPSGLRFLDGPETWGSRPRLIFCRRSAAQGLPSLQNVFPDVPEWSWSNLSPPRGPDRHLRIG